MDISNRRKKNFKITRVEIQKKKKILSNHILYFSVSFTSVYSLKITSKNANVALKNLKIKTVFGITKNEIKIKIDLITNYELHHTYVCTCIRRLLVESSSFFADGKLMLRCVVLVLFCIVTQF